MLTHLICISLCVRQFINSPAINDVQELLARLSTIPEALELSRVAGLTASQALYNAQMIRTHSLLLRTAKAHNFIIGGRQVLLHSNFAVMKTRISVIVCDLLLHFALVQVEVFLPTHLGFKSSFNSPSICNLAF